MKHLTLLSLFLMIAVSSFGQAPTTNAPDPAARDAEDVISIFSDAYTDVAITNYNPNWGQAGFNTANPSYDPGSGNLILAYPIFNYQGIELSGSQNIAEMEFLHVDIFITSSINPNIYAISSGAEMAQPITNAGAGTWTSVDIPVDGITGDPTSVVQFKFDGGAGAADSIYIDNLYFWKNPTTPQNDASLSDLKVDGETIPGFSSGLGNYTYGLPSGTTTVPQITAATTTAANATTVITQATGIPGEATVVVESEDETKTKTYTVSFAITSPGTAAPTPEARDAEDVISIYSDAYTDIALDALSASFDDSEVTEVMIEGNATLKVDFTNFLGIDFSSNKQDASAMTHLHIDFWTPEVPIGGVFNSKLTDFGGTSAETSAITFDVNAGTDPALVAGTWISADFPIPSGASRADIAQYIITVSNTLDIVHIDNIYMYNDGTGNGGNNGGTSSTGDLFTENFDLATSVDGWTKAANASDKPAEVTHEWAETAGLEGSGAMRFGGTNADGVGGRAYILEKVFTGVDFEGATNVTVSVSIKSEGLVGTNLALLTDIGGSVKEIASANANLSESEYYTYTFEHTGISAQANSVKLLMNVAAGAAQGDGGTILVDDLIIDSVATTDPTGELLTNGDFELGNDGSWFGNALDIRTEGGNSYNFANVTSAGAPNDVNLSNGVAITQGETYVLSFEASTAAGETRTMVAGIGLNEGNYTAKTETVTLTDQNQIFNLTLTAATFGSANSRVLFDMGADVGVVVIDKVSLKIGEPEPVPVPEVAAPTPAERNPVDVISLFSDAYTDITPVNFAPVWTEALVEEITVADNATKKITFTNFAGIDFSGSKQDASAMTHFHMDFWVGETELDGKVFNLKLVDFGGGSAEASFMELSINTGTDPAITSGSWVSVDVPFSAWTNSNNIRSDLAQLVITSNLDVVYVDNMYMYNEVPTSNEDDGGVPKVFALDQNYPNPFNPTTNISFSLPTAGDVTLEVYNIQGQKVATLVNGFKNSGSHNISFDASNLASGVYVYRLTSNKSVQVRKMLLIK
jgi:hypothetical protein